MARVLNLQSAQNHKNPIMILKFKNLIVETKKIKRKSLQAFVRRKSQLLN